MSMGPVERKIRDAMRGGRAITAREAAGYGALGKIYYRRFLDRGISMQVQMPGGGYGTTLREFDPEVAAARDERDRTAALVKPSEADRQAAAVRLEAERALIERAARLPLDERRRLFDEHRLLERASRSLSASDVEGDVSLDVFNLSLE